MSTIVQQITRLPQTLIESDVSPFEIVEKSGLRNEPAAFTLSRIERELKDSPELIDHWMQYSEDKRSGGWYFLRRSTGSYIVGRYPGGEEMEFGQAHEACAVFVKNESESILSHAT